ncbi:MAG: tail fiber domain-containing protein [Bacteroidetes bacterium]|nr:tail fiber domain-containing protein [Bacteroidota bacterium]
MPFTPTYATFGEVFRTDAPDFDATGAIFSFWRMWTGPPDNALEHLAIFNSDSWSIIPSPFNDINFRATSGNMFLWTESGPPNRATKRMMINNDNPTNLAVQGVTNANAVDPNWNTNGYVGIGNNNSNQWDPDLGGAGAHTLLHLEGPNNTGFIGRGWRSWMRTGILMKENSDNIYLGMKNEFSQLGNNRSDAVLAWGDDQVCEDCTVSDNFRMIFTGIAPTGNGNGTTNPLNAGTYAGREVMRMTHRGRMGIGQTFTSTVGPDARLELLDELNFTTGVSRNLPQLRLTFSQAVPPNPFTTGISVDFQATAAGDLFIRPRNATTNRNVGINTASPGNTLTLETGFAAASSVESGLRFNNLTTATTTIIANPFGATKGVLSVDAQGDVILVEDKDGNVTNACGSPSFVPRMLPTPANTIGCSQIFDDLITVGVGVGTAVDNAYRLHMRGDFLIEHGTSATNGDIYMLDNGSPNVKQRVFAMYGQNGNSSLAVGPLAGASGTTGDVRNTYVGFRAGNAAVGNLENTFIGASSGLVYSSSTSSGLNTFVGANSGNQITDGTYNTFVGRLSGHAFTTGTRNTVLGANAGNGGAPAGDDNVMIGWETAFDGTPSLTSVTRSVLIGNGAYGRSNGTTMDNAVSIGFNNRVVCDNCVTMASQNLVTGLTEQQVGIGYANPNTTVITPTPTGSNLAKLYVRDFNFGGTAAFFNGSAYASGLFTASDVALKQNITPFTDASTIIDQLEAKSFDFKHQDYPSMALPLGNQVGFWLRTLN